jgi:hypothetical protein
MTQSAASTVSRNVFGIIALLLAGIGLLVGLVRLSGFITLILGMLAVLLGLLGALGTRRGIATNRTMTVIAAVLGVGTAALGVWSISTGSRGPAEHRNGGHVPSAIDDVAIVDCSVISGDGVRAVNATVKITNPTDRPQTYLTTIKINNAKGVRIGRINTVSNALGAGQSVTVSGMDTSDTAVNGTRTGPAKCVVAKVNRFPATMSCPPGEVDAKLC